MPSTLQSPLWGRSADRLLPRSARPAPPSTLGPILTSPTRADRRPFLASLGIPLLPRLLRPWLHHHRVQPDRQRVRCRPGQWGLTLMLFVVRARSNLALHFLQVIHRVGHVGLDLVTTIIIGDVSPLEWRGLFQGLNCECPLVSWVHCADRAFQMQPPHGLSTPSSVCLVYILVSLLCSSRLSRFSWIHHLRPRCGWLALGLRHVLHCVRTLQFSVFCAAVRLRGLF